MNDLFHCENLEVAKRIGKGSFSNVYLCNLKASVRDGFSELFIVKEINITGLLKKYIKHQFRKSTTYLTTNMNVTPHSLCAKEDDAAMYTRYYNKIKALVDSEVDVSKMLFHENIVNFYGNCVMYDVYYLSMEYCDGGDLHKILKRSKEFPRNMYGGIREDIVKTVVVQIASALRYLDTLNLIHRDIKLHNLLYKDGVFKLADFGFACYDMSDVPPEEVDMNDTLSSKYYKVCGTPFYMAPELLDSFGATERCTRYCKKIDIWSFGLCIFELLFNKMPFNRVGSFEDLQAFFIDQGRAQAEIQSFLVQSNKWLSSELRSFLLLTLVIEIHDRVNINELSIFLKNNMCVNETPNPFESPSESIAFESWEKIDSNFERWLFDDVS
jgi:serine/threonine protein kinase